MRLTRTELTAGEGASRWVAKRRDKAGMILLVFDEPMDISHCAFEAEERELPTAGCTVFVPVG